MLPLYVRRRLQMPQNRSRIYGIRKPIVLTVEDMVEHLDERGEVVFQGSHLSVHIWTEYLFDGTPYYCTSTGDEYDCPYEAIVEILSLIGHPLEIDPS